MPIADHAHPVDADAVATARANVLTPSDADRLSRLLALLCDPTRARILFALVAVDELCVGDVAAALDISMDQSSYGLRALRQAASSPPDATAASSTTGSPKASPPAPRALPDPAAVQLDEGELNHVRPGFPR